MNPQLTDIHAASTLTTYTFPAGAGKLVKRSSTPASTPTALKAFAASIISAACSSYVHPHSTTTTTTIPATTTDVSATSSTETTTTTTTTSTETDQLFTTTTTTTTSTDTIVSGVATATTEACAGPFGSVNAYGLAINGIPIQNPIGNGYTATSCCETCYRTSNCLLFMYDDGYCELVQTPGGAGSAPLDPECSLGYFAAAIYGGSDPGVGGLGPCATGF